MPITGIDYNKCINCYICLESCARPLYQIVKEKEHEKVIFNDPDNTCILCGHCIAQCPEDAILYEDIGESFTFEGVENPESILSYDTLLNFIATNRSIRKYKKEKVPKELLEKVIKAMEYAPTGANMRTESFTIITNKEVIKKMSDAILDELHDILGEHFDVLIKQFHSPIYYDAPHIIIVSSPFNMIMEGFNVGNIITYGRLAAQSLGLGTCYNGYTQIAIEKNPKIKKIAKIRGHIFGAFTIGYPDVKFCRVPPRPKKVVKYLE
jgi:nitroreductase/NAD-dependent dihydropyrimidine dehydrogenase PreA subunit